MDALFTGCSCNTNVMWFGHGCSGHQFLLQQERYHSFGVEVQAKVKSDECLTAEIALLGFLLIRSGRLSRD